MTVPAKMPKPFGGYFEPRDAEDLAPNVAIAPSTNCWVREGLVRPRNGYYWYVHDLSKGQFEDQYQRRDEPHVHGRWRAQGWYEHLDDSGPPIEDNLYYLRQLELHDGCAVGGIWDCPGKYHPGLLYPKPATFWSVMTSSWRPTPLYYSVYGDLKLWQVSEPAWVERFAFLVRCRQPVAYGCPLCELNHSLNTDTTDAAGFVIRWTGAAYQIFCMSSANDGTVTDRGSPSGWKNMVNMGTHNTDRTIPFRLDVIDMGAGYFQLKFYLWTGTWQLEKESGSILNTLVEDLCGGYVRLYSGVYATGYKMGKEAPVQNEADHYGFDDVSIDVGSSTDLARVNALAVVPTPQLEGMGPSSPFTADQLMLASIGRTWRVAQISGATWSTWHTIIGLDVEPSDQPVIIPTPRGYVLMDGENPPFLTNGFWAWQLGIEPPTRRVAADPWTSGNLDAEKDYEYVLTFCNEETGEESPPNGSYEKTLPAGKGSFYLGPIHPPVSPGVTHLRVYRRCITDGEAIFRRVGEYPLWYGVWDNMGNADVPQDADHELRSDLGLIPYKPWAGAWFGSRLFAVGHEWDEVCRALCGLLSDAATTKGLGQITFTSWDGNHPFWRYREQFTGHNDLFYIDAKGYQYEDKTGGTTGFGAGWYYSWDADKQMPSPHFDLDKNPGGISGYWAEVTGYVLRPKPQGLRWSSLRYMTSFPDMNHEGIGGDQAIVGSIPWGEQLIIGCTNSLWAIIGMDPSTWLIIQRHPDVALASRMGWCQIKGLLYFAAQDGIYTYDGRAVSPMPISAAIQGLWDEIPDAQKHRIAMCHDEENGFLLVALCINRTGYSPTDDNNCLLQYDYRAQQWMPPAPMPISCFATTTDGTGKQVIYAGTPVLAGPAGGRVVRLWRDNSGALIFRDSAYSGDSGDLFNSEWWGAHWDLGVDGKKRIQAVEFEVEADESLGTPTKFDAGLHFPDGTSKKIEIDGSQDLWRTRVMRRQRSAGLLVDFQKGTNVPDATMKVKGFKVEHTPTRHGR